MATLAGVIDLIDGVIDFVGAGLVRGLFASHIGLGRPACTGDHAE